MVRSVPKRSFTIGPLLLRRVGGTVRALTMGGRELTLPLSDVVRAYSAPGGWLILRLRTGMVDYFKWHATSPHGAGRRLAAVGDWLCPSCGSSLYRGSCPGCEADATPRILWVDAAARQALLELEEGRRLSPWEVLEVCSDQSGRLLARCLVLGGGGLGAEGPLLRLSPSWFRRPVIEVMDREG